MKYTKNNLFNLPEGSDIADISKINANFEKLDNIIGSYTFTQARAATQWEIAHNLGKYPSVTIVDSAGTQLVGEVTYTDENNVVISFTAAFSGKAYLN